VSDETRLQVTAKDADSSLSLSKVAPGLVARGRRDAEGLVLREPTDRLSKARQLAERGDADAQYELGEAYYEGQGVPRDYAEALGWFRKAADQFHLYANTHLGNMYERGEGVPADRAEAVRYYSRAADIAIAYCESEGLRGWDPDWVMGAVDKGAEHGHTEAQVLAIAWQRLKLPETRRRAEEGDDFAQWRLGHLYQKGEVVPQDYVLAHMWFNLSASNSSGDYQGQGAKARDEVAGKMTPGQIAEAQRLAREWKPKPRLET